MACDSAAMYPVLLAGYFFYIEGFLFHRGEIRVLRLIWALFFPVFNYNPLFTELLYFNLLAHFPAEVADKLYG